MTARKFFFRVESPGEGVTGTTGICATPSTPAAVHSVGTVSTSPTPYRYPMMSVSPVAGVTVTVPGAPTMAVPGGPAGNAGRSVEDRVGCPGVALSTMNWHHGDVP